MRRSLMCLLAPGILGCASASASLLELFPAEPTSSDTVTVSVVVPDLCAPVTAQGGDLRMVGNVVRVELKAAPVPHPCSGFGETRSFEIGRLPAGTYNVDLTIDGLEHQDATLAFEVSGAELSDRVGPGFDVGGLWWSVDDPGWSLVVEQVPSGQLVAMFATYDEEGAPTWMVVMPGAWLDGSYVSDIARMSEGPWFGRPSPSVGGSPPALPDTAVVGTSTLTFVFGPGPIQTGVFEYEVGNVVSTRTITRFLF